MQHKRQQYMSNVNINISNSWKTIVVS
jgi:hypothetical protein